MGLFDSPSREARLAWLSLLACLLVAGLAAWFVWSPLGGSSGAKAAAGLTINLDCPVEAAVDDSTYYQYTISNSGTETLHRVSVEDDLFGAITSKFPGTLSPSQSDTAGNIRNVLESDPRPLVNEVTAIYKTDDGTEVTATDTCKIDVPHLTVKKECSLSAGVFTFTFTITNDGSTPLIRWIAKDSTLGNMFWEFPETLAVGQTETVTFTKPQLPWDNLCNWAEVAYRTESSTVVKVRPRCCVTPTPPGSVTLTKFKEVGPFTKPLEVCFRLDFKTNGFVPSPDPPEGAEQCKAPDANGNATFTWTNLPPGDYRIVETKEVCEVKGVVQDPCQTYQPLPDIPFTMPDPPQAIVLPKAVNTLGSGELCLEKLNPDGSRWAKEDVTFTVTSLTDPLFPEQTHLIPSEGNPVCKKVPEGTYKICETPPPNYTVQPSVCQTVEVVAGAPVAVTVTFVNTREGEGCTPGFWKAKRHLVHWAPTGFSPGDPFEVVFGTAPEPFKGDPTLLDVVGFGGGGIKALSRHAVAALLNAAHPDVSYGLSPAEVIAAYQVAVASGDRAVITAQKDIFEGLNEAGCPVN